MDLNLEIQPVEDDLGMDDEGDEEIPEQDHHHMDEDEDEDDDDDDDDDLMDQDAGQGRRYNLRSRSSRPTALQQLLALMVGGSRYAMQALLFLVSSSSSQYFFSRNEPVSDSDGSSDEGGAINFFRTRSNKKVKPEQNLVEVRTESTSTFK